MKLATLCYVKHNNHTLMLQRGKKAGDIHAGKWNGLGGKLEPGESPEECVIREVQEESGLSITKPKLVGLLTFPKFKDNEDWYVYAFTADDFTGKLIDSPEGELDWIPDDKLLTLPLWEGDHHFLKWISENKFFSAKFIYENKKLMDSDVVFY